MPQPKPWIRTRGIFSGREGSCGSITRHLITAPSPIGTYKSLCSELRAGDQREKRVLTEEHECTGESERSYCREFSSRHHKVGPLMWVARKEASYSTTRCVHFWLSLSLRQKIGLAYLPPFCPGWLRGGGSLGSVELAAMSVQDAEEKRRCYGSHRCLLTTWLAWSSGGGCGKRRVPIRMRPSVQRVLLTITCLRCTPTIIRFLVDAGCCRCG